MNSNYDKYLLNEVYTLVFGICVLLILAIVIAYFAITDFKNHNKSNAMVSGIIVAVIIVTCVVTVVGYLVPYISDIENQSYIRYEGTFYVSDGAYDPKSGSKPLITFADEEKGKRFTVRNGAAVLSDGSHKGYIIYSERSKIIVEWHCNDCRQK